VNRGGRYLVSSGSDYFVSTAAVSRVRPIRMGSLMSVRKVETWL
jgi:hypothetical protein